MKLLSSLILIFSILGIPVHSEQTVRWCVTKEAEEVKCQKFAEAIEIVRAEGLAALEVQNFYRNNGAVDFSTMPTLSCVRGIDVFDCMEIISNNEADLITLEAGHGYYAGRFHSLRPIMAEVYNTDPSAPLEYYSVAVKRANTPFRLDNLKGAKACISGMGMGAGWVNPIATMLQLNMISVSECNAVVKTTTDFFSQMCLPGALNSFYNPFGNNPTTSCELCSGSGAELCSASDPHAGYDGAFRCLAGAGAGGAGVGDIAFLRSDTVPMMTFNTGEFELMCRDSTTRPVDDFLNCNFGTVPNDIVMTAGLKTNAMLRAYKNFLQQMVVWFSATGAYKDTFQMFSSQPFGYLGRSNLLFNDNTKTLVDVGNRDRYYTWVDDTFNNNLNNLNYCPIAVARLCVISDAEQEKCERMVEAFRGKDIKPDLDCLKGTSTQDCMKLIQSGDADMMVLDAGDVFIGGRDYGLVPIAAEDYGDMTHSFKVVAATWKRNLYMTLYNLKRHRACHAGIGRGDGWIVPLNIYIETQQFIPQQCTIFENIGQLFARSCIPGALDKEYNPNQKPINLCEGCSGGGYRKCQRNALEVYYGTTGAFRCLVENAGDVAFVHHLTVGDNTDGRNQAIWARNRRSDDYELLCKDGTRASVEDWQRCYLGEVPAAALVTSGHRQKFQRDIYWNLFSYGQQFFSSDIDGDFHLFDSGMFYTDLIFNDEAVRLMPLPEEEQNYETYLGWDFINQIHNLDQYVCIPTQGSAGVNGSLSLLLIAISAILILL